MKVKHGQDGAKISVLTFQAAAHPPDKCGRSVGGSSTHTPLCGSSFTLFFPKKKEYICIVSNYETPTNVLLASPLPPLPLHCVHAGMNYRGCLQQRVASHTEWGKNEYDFIFFILNVH